MDVMFNSSYGFSQSRWALQSGTLALWSVFRNRRRVALAIGSVSFGITALILAGGFIEWIFWATREGTIQQGLGHIQVARSGFHDLGRSDLSAYLLSPASPTLATLRAEPGIQTVAPRRIFSGLISRGDVTLSFLGEAVDPASERNFGNVSIITKGNNLSADLPNEIIVGGGLAANLGAFLGDTVVILANVPNGGVNAVEVRVRGLFATVSKAYDDSAIHVHHALADKLLKVSGSHTWTIVLRNTADTSATLARLRKQYAGFGIEFLPWYELADFYNKTVTLLSRQMNVIQSIIALIIVLTISNSMMMGVIERTNEIGTTMALGATRRAILLQFVEEGLLLGVIGGLLGTTLGLGLARLISIIGIPMPPPPGQTQGYQAGILVEPALVFSSLAIAVIAALLASIYPAWRASRIPIIEALRHNR